MLDIRKYVAVAMVWCETLTLNKKSESFGAPNDLFFPHSSGYSLGEAVNWVVGLDLVYEWNSLVI